ncbi:EAL domain-containing protein [Phormidium sp. CCY1219]|uniref:EAL domain-containing protein n=1 Tax=Phormidium sp. CCY1219 TaxID=2886104 RepID=UPI002D1E86A1|nr:EAL domain-containing protein [Phormidium sp. CCY1219]MEB3830353.1 EAL domain-containing protein [Phormidium sp. CCY1219]
MELINQLVELGFAGKLVIEIGDRCQGKLVAREGSISQAAMSHLMDNWGIKNLERIDLVSEENRSSWQLFDEIPTHSTHSEASLRAEQNRVEPGVSCAKGDRTLAIVNAAIGQDNGSESVTVLHHMNKSEDWVQGGGESSAIANFASETLTLNAVKQELERTIEQRSAQLETANQQLQAEIARRSRIEAELEDSLSLLRGTLEANPDGIIVSKNGSEIATFNQNFLQMWGISEAAIASRKLENLLPLMLQQLKEPNAFLCQGQDAFSQPDAEGYGIYELKDGRIFERYSKPQWQGEEIVGRLCSFRDITQRTRTEAALSESERRYRAIIEQVSEGIFLLDVPSMRILEANPAYCQLLGYSEAELCTRTIYELVERDREELDGIIHQLLTEKNCLCSAGCHRRQDGSLVNVEVCFSLISYGGKEVISVVVRDISDRIEAEQALRQAERKYRSIFENAVEGIFQTTLEGHYVTANPMLARIYGYDSPEQLRQELSDIERQLYVDAGRREEFIRRIERQGEVRDFESQIYRKDGTVIWISENACGVYNDAGELVGYEGTVQDISDRVRVQEELQQSRQMLQLVIDNIPQSIYWKDKNAVYMGCNGNFARAAGFATPEEIIGKTDYEIPLKTQQAAFFRQCDFCVMNANEPQYHTIEPQDRVDGKQYWVESNRIPLKDSQGNAIGILGTYEDVTERKLAEATIRYQATHDLLTGLPNRMLFDKRLQEELQTLPESENKLAVMFIDLDRFKTINDTLGHAMGDRLLEAVTERVTNCLRETDTLARWGGDEFTLLLPNIHGEADAAQIAQRILDRLTPTFDLEGHPLHISSSIGIALCSSSDELTAENLLKNADAALYRAKERGRNNYQFYTPALNSKASELFVLENELHNALTREEFVVYYQPQINTATGEISGIEALVRWQHPELGLVSPAKFIPLAEETGLIVPIGEWVLRTVCRQMKAWREAGLPPIRVAVNFCARQIEHPNLIETIATILSENGLEPEWLELEITENAAMQNGEKTRMILQQLDAMGVHLSVDDFGTGYSSLAYLKQFPLNTLKIDKSFVRELTMQSKDAGIIDAIMLLGKKFNFRVVAEGVETEEHQRLLECLGCEEMQGYLFSKPLPGSDATRLLCNGDN